MARPPKSEDYVVYRITDLFQYSDGLPWSTLRRGDLWELTLADQRVVIGGERDIHLAIGELLCKLKPEYRPHVLRQIANALERKPGKLRKSGKFDDIAKIRLSWRKAKIDQKGLYRGDNPTFKQVATHYHNLTGLQLDRRALKDAGCPVRSEGKSKRLLRAN
jgi:hypothetical protein